MVDKILKTIGIIMLEGTLSLATQKIREVSRDNYGIVKDDTRMIINKGRNKLLGNSLEDYDDML